MNRLTPIVKNLLLINVVIFLLSYLIGLDRIIDYAGLYYFAAPKFFPFQFFTYMFLHGSFMHMLFNMLGLFFLGPLLEQFWGTTRFITFYLVCGIGAGFIYNGINFFTIKPMEQKMVEYQLNPTPENFFQYVSEYYTFRNGKVKGLYEEFYDNPQSESLKRETTLITEEIYQLKLNIPMVGASGAIYGILMAFGLLFPNTQLMLLFPPIPIKAKYLVLILGGIALYSGFQNNPGDNVAHFAHLGGMIFAFIMIRIWQKDRTKFF